MPTKCGDAHHPTDVGVRASSRRPIVTPPSAAMLTLLAHVAALLLLLTNDHVLRVAAVTPNNARRTFSLLGCRFPAAAGSSGGEGGIVGGSCTPSDGGEGRRRIGRGTGVIKIASDDDSIDPSSSFGTVLMAAPTTLRGGGGRGRAGDGKVATSTSTDLRVSPPSTSVDGHVPPYRPLPDSTTSPRPETDDADAVSIATAIAVAIRHLVTPDRCLRAVSLVGAYYLARAIFRGMKDLVDELYDEATREEHDQPLVSEDVIADLSSSMMATVMGEGGMSQSDSASSARGERGDKNGIYNLGGWRGGPSGESGRDPTGVGGAPANRGQRHRRAQRLSPRHRHARSLILKLHSAGFPLEAQVQEAHQNLLRRQQAQGIAPSQAPAPPSGIRTAESVLRSLTKSEGQLLTSCLLTPEDLGGGSGGNGNDQRNPWDQIGGLADVKESLLDLTYPLLASPPDGAAACQYGGLLSHPPGVLLFGPPGCGKTLLARTLARTAGARFLSVAPSSLLRKFVGETNLNVRALFSLARKLQPCVVFVDEMDGLFRERQSSGGQGHDEHDVSRDLKTEFMQLWDGIASTKGGGGGGDSSSPPDRVLVIGATNRPFDVDSAFLRRMPRSYFVGLPDYDARVSVLMAALSAGVPVTPDFDVGRIAAETEGYSPSDLGEVLRTAALFPLREARAAAAAASGRRPPGASPTPLPPLRDLSTEDVLRALGTVSPTPYSPAYRAALAEYASRCGAHRHHQPMDGSSSASSSSSKVFPHDGDDGMMGRSTNHQRYDGGDFFGGGAGAVNDGGPGGSYLNYHGAEADDESSDMYSEDEDEEEMSSDFE